MFITSWCLRKIVNGGIKEEEVPSMVFKKIIQPELEIDAISDQDIHEIRALNTALFNYNSLMRHMHLHTPSMVHQYTDSNSIEPVRYMKDLFDKYGSYNELNNDKGYRIVYIKERATDRLMIVIDGMFRYCLFGPSKYRVQLCEDILDNVGYFSGRTNSEGLYSSLSRIYEYYILESTRAA